MFTCLELLERVCTFLELPSRVSDFSHVISTSDMPTYYPRTYKRRRTSYKRSFYRGPKRYYRKSAYRGYRRSGKVHHHSLPHFPRTDLSGHPISKMTAHKPNNLGVRPVSQRKRPLGFSILPGPDPSLPTDNPITWTKLVNDTSSLIDAYAAAGSKLHQGVNAISGAIYKGGKLAAQAKLVDAGLKFAIGSHSAEKPNPLREGYDRTLTQLGKVPRKVFRKVYEAAKDVPLMIAPPAAVAMGAAANQAGYFDNIKATWEALPSASDMGVYATGVMAPYAKAYYDYMNMGNPMPSFGLRAHQ